MRSTCRPERVHHASDKGALSRHDLVFLPCTFPPTLPSTPKTGRGVVHIDLFIPPLAFSPFFLLSSPSPSVQYSYSPSQSITSLPAIGSSPRALLHSCCKPAHSPGRNLPRESFAAMATQVPYGHPQGGWNHAPQQLPPAEQDDSGVQVRPMGRKSSPAEYDGGVWQS